MGCQGSLGSRRSSITSDHRAGPPPRDPHEVPLVAATGEPLMSKGVAELMGVDASQASLKRPTAHDLTDAGIGQPPLVSQPERRARVGLVAVSSPDVTVQSPNRLSPDRKESLSSSFT